MSRVGHWYYLSRHEDQERQFVSVTGNAMLMRDRDRIRELWDAALTTYFPRGAEDPHLVLLCVRIETAEYWDAPSGQMIALFSGPAGNGEHTKVAVRATPASG